MKALFLLLSALALAASGEGFDRAAFAQPENIFTPGFFWMWNTKLEPKVLNAQLDDMVANGVRSVCIHPFPKGFRPTSCISTMEPDYLTPEYLKVFSDVVDHAADLGMSVWLYDEGGWPSGRACGLVNQADREGRFKARLFGYGPKGVGDQPFGLYQTSGPSSAEPGATESFLEITHERYRQAVGRHFGKTIRFTFTDEPGITGFSERGLGWPSDFSAAFRAEKGYDLEPLAKELFDRRDEYVEALAKPRIDYGDLRAKYFCRRYLDPIRDWCARNGLKSSGHLNGEDEPERSMRYGYSSILGACRALDIPGVDVIWRQLFPAKNGQSGGHAPFPRYAASTAHQKGEPLVLCESFGIYGDSVSPDEMKWLVDFLMVRGVNLHVFGYYNVSNAGQWMALFEPHNGPVQPYWEMERPFFDYIARVSAILADGRPAGDVLCYFDQNGFWAGGAETAETTRLHYRVAELLDARNCDFDYADDEALLTAKVEDGRLRIGKMAYASLVIPTSKFMDPKVRKLIDAFRAAGGRVSWGEDVSAAQPTLAISGDGASSLRVAKRMKDGESVYFVVNESVSPVRIDLDFGSAAGQLSVADLGRGGFRPLAAKGGRVTWEFPSCGSAVFLTGGRADLPAERTFAGPVQTLADGWTLRKAVTHFPGKDDFVIRSEPDAVAVPVALGDWRDALGQGFSGKAVYRIAFDSPVARTVRLDLGRVCWACDVRLNGKDLGCRFFGPYAWTVTLARGRNVLEIKVANLLSNALQDADRDRIFRDHPPVSWYDRYQRPFDHDNLEGGLYGPVTLTNESKE